MTSSESGAATCRAALEDGRLVIENGLFRREWEVRNGLLHPASFRFGGREWCAGSTPSAAPYPAEGVPEEKRTVRFKAHVEQGPVQEPALVAELTCAGPSATLRYRFVVFDKSPGASIELAVERSNESRGDSPGPSPAESGETAPTGVEVAPPPVGDKDPLPLYDAADRVRLRAKHLRLIHTRFQDQTDIHDELVLEQEWLLHTSEANVALQGDVFVLEDVLTGEGLIFLKLAPLPYARPVPCDCDFRIHNRAGSHAALYGHGADDADYGYPTILLAYAGGRAGRIAALQQHQRCYRRLEPGQPVTFLTNTWGDRSRDGRIQEAFMLQEADAAEKLGADVVQIDDGWCQGSTSNSVRPGGVWEGYWAADSAFWSVDRERFPRGLEPVIESVSSRGMNLGLWFGPDSASDFAHWEKDAEVLIEFWRRSGGVIRDFKLDGIKVKSKLGERNLHHFMNRVLEETEGAVRFDLDITAEVRPGYFGAVHTGPLFVENRYTDWHRYWPHHTLRNLWTLAQYVDPRRMRFEFLNIDRNRELYEGDDLAPARYAPDYLFASVMFANPLGWFEASNLPQDYFEKLPALVRVWRQHRAAMFSGAIVPIGETPDGTSWTGFASTGDGHGAYALIFRELNDRAEAALDASFLGAGSMRCRVLAGDGQLRFAEGRLEARIEAPLSYVFARLEAVA